MYSCDAGFTVDNPVTMFHWDSENSVKTWQKITHKARSALWYFISCLHFIIHHDILNTKLKYFKKKHIKTFVLICTARWAVTDTHILFWWSGLYLTIILTHTLFMHINSQLVLAAEGFTLIDCNSVDLSQILKNPLEGTAPFHSKF